MNAPKYIQRGLKDIDGLYFAVYNSNIREGKSMSFGRGRWQVRRWTGNSPKRLNLWNCYGYSEEIMTVCEEKVTDMGLEDAGYEDIDWRVVLAIGESNWWKLRWKQKIAEMDARNAKKEELQGAELEYESRYAAKHIWRSMREPTVHLSGKEWRF